MFDIAIEYHNKNNKYYKLGVKVAEASIESCSICGKKEKEHWFCWK